MDTIRKLINTALIVCLLLSVVIIWQFYRNAIDRIKTEEAKLEEIFALQKDSLKRLNELLEQANKKVQIPINDCTVYEVTTKDSVRISTLLDKGNLLIRFIRTGCSSCIKQQIEVLEYLSYIDNALMLVSSESMRDLRIFLLNNGIKQKVYWLKPTENLFEGDDSSRFLIAFMENNKMIAKSVFFDFETLYLTRLIFAQK